MRYEGGCHCGGIGFEVEGEITEAYDCNCSLCRKRGGLLWFAPRAALVLKTPESGVATYTFHKHAIRHHYCPQCGISPFSEGDDPRSGPMVCVNVRCLPDVELASLKVVPIDGAKM